MRRRKTVAWCLTIGLAATAAAQSGPRQDGRWKVQVQMSMPDMPVQLPPMTSEHCLTPEDVKDPIRTVEQATGPGSGNPGAECKLTNYQVVGNKVTWAMECAGGTPMSGNGELLYSGDTYTGTIAMTMQGQTMTAKVDGVRLGDCVR